MTENAYWFLGNLAIIHVPGEQTDDRVTVIELLAPPDDMTPLHRHKTSQTTCVLEGEVTIFLPGGESRVLGHGELIHHPAGTPKTQRITSSIPARELDINSPAGFDRFIAEVGQPAESLTLPPPSESPPDPGELAAAAAKHGIEILGPPGELP
jgi:quercetin dioxygenase-like cupin family protein